MPNYDIIGDVHGEGEKLEGLLSTLGYTYVEGAYRHHDRSAVFVGDLIDRGPNQRLVLETVRAMSDVGSALVVMGNHEFNALAYATPHPTKPGEFCRAHNRKNRRQHAAFLDQLGLQERRSYIEWFMSMPLWLDLGDLRVVHACWHEASRARIEKLLRGDHLTSADEIADATHRDGALYGAMQVLLKGPELDLRAYGAPSFADGQGNPRHRARIRWWMRDAKRLCDVVDITSGDRGLDGEPYPMIDEDILVNESDTYLVEDDVPVFYGHYWRDWDPLDRGFRQWRPSSAIDVTTTSACVDYSASRNGPLVAYQWHDGDTQVHFDQFVAYR